jgi:hypothetical protein
MGFARSMGRQAPAEAAGAADLAVGEALLRRCFEWAPGVDRFSPVQVESRFEANLPDPAGGDRELVGGDGRPIRYQGRVDLLAGLVHSDRQMPRSGHERGIAQHEASGGGRSLPYARRRPAGPARPTPEPWSARATGSSGGP